MRPGAFAIVLVLCLGLSGGLSGCLGNTQTYNVVQGGSFEEPYSFSGRLDRGDMESMRDEMKEELRSFSSYELTLQNQNGRASFRVTVDGEDACEKAREKVGGLEFIRSRSSCASVP